MIVKARRRSKVESKKRNRRSLPPARVSAAPLCLVGSAAAVEAAHHVDLGCALFEDEEELRLAKIRGLKGLVES
jgi:ribosomal protein L32